MCDTNTPLLTEACGTRGIYSVPGGVIICCGGGGGIIGLKEVGKCVCIMSCGDICA